MERLISKSKKPIKPKKPKKPMNPGMAGPVSRSHRFFRFFRFFRFLNQSFHCVFKAKSKKPPLKHKLYCKFGHRAYVLNDGLMILLLKPVGFLIFIGQSMKSLCL